MSSVRWIGIVIVAILAASHSDASAEGIRPTSAMDSDPVLLMPSAPPPDVTRLKELWLLALKRPEAELQRLAAESIVRAHDRGLFTFLEAEDALMQVATAEKSHPTARNAAARALVILDCRSAADALRAAAPHSGSVFRQIVEPALAKWGDGPQRDIWLARLAEKATPRRELLLALGGLGVVREARGAKPCLELALEPRQTPDVRLAAARAAGQIVETGLEEDAGRLAASTSPQPLSLLCATALLARHRSAEAQQLLLRLAKDAEPSVANEALLHLLAIDPALVVPLAEAAMANADADVRQRGVEAYVRLPTPERIGPLSKLLDDVHPRVRTQVREDLLRLAKMAELEEPVRQAAMAVLAGDSWRGQEQAALLLTALDHKAAGPRLVELLESQRPEVMIATAWGLRVLAIPELLPAMLDKAQRQTEVRASQGERPGLDAQVGHLVEAMGTMKHKPAEPLLRGYITKVQGRNLSRSGSIWSLGHLHAGTPDEELAVQLKDRLTDRDTFNPEQPIVRIASTISLARMKAISQIEAMRGWMGPTTEPDPVEIAIRWALIDMTGQELPPTTPPEPRLGTWFLEPLQVSKPASP